MSIPSPIEEFPFGTRLSLAHLIDFWERQDEDPNSLHAPLARVIVEKGSVVGIVTIGDVVNAFRRVAEDENAHLRQYIQAGR